MSTGPKAIDASGMDVRIDREWPELNYICETLQSCFLNMRTWP